MKFSKEFLVDSLDDKLATVENVISGHSRWAIQYRRIFKHEGKFYLTTYSVGATESQDESPYEYESGDIECPEVVPVEKMVTVYVPA